MDRYGPKHVELTPMHQQTISAVTLCISLECIYTPVLLFIEQRVPTTDKPHGLAILGTLPTYTNYALFRFHPGVHAAQKTERSPIILLRTVAWFHQRIRPFPNWRNDESSKMS